MLLQRNHKRNHWVNKLKVKGIYTKPNRWLLLLLLFPLLILSACTSGPENSKKDDATPNKENTKSSGTAFKVVIDPGHGGKDNGATGASGRYEKNFTLSLSKKVQKLLEDEPEIEVLMTRTDDSFLSQESRYRPKYANKQNADVFISIHGNIFSDPDVSGTETFYYHKHSRQLAQTIQKHVVEATEFRDRGIKKEELFVVKDTEMPASLIEVGYMTNPQEESKMWTDEFQSRVATSIVEGIKEYREQSEGQGNLEWIS
ncbi:N-acetylmuramoyl-L-alanine amidase [Sediminibacillus dalangtanensis]|uniref:N-acetylmuramoyl-L-alanine amidase n=1 Tax=Sediminibacillus dalangtanensis TaxID=2729421 RepID=A0ABX7VUK2_9BACI|nr:N-acetylmuramoyl-L-alanine amidase [Sediminibacillus dalangtanensis]QTM98276.1 N-acetylmuramoyl-L-alanine amidase [Sediminibacillus dalangtanensis]